MKSKILTLIIAVLIAVSLSACSLESLSFENLFGGIFGGTESENDNKAEVSQMISESSESLEEVTDDLDEELSESEIEIIFQPESNIPEAEQEIEDEPAIEEPEAEEPENKEPVIISTENLTASSSSVLIEEGEDYNPGTLIDGDMNTTWVEGVNGTGAGEWVKIETADGSKLNITAIGFTLGFQREERLLNNNGWPTKVLLEFESGYAQVADFNDCRMPSVIMLKEAQETSFVKITILDAVEGAKYADTCITEITLLGIE